jgi:hypothetical protein
MKLFKEEGGQLLYANEAVYTPTGTYLVSEGQKPEGWYLLDAEPEDICIHWVSGPSYARDTKVIHNGIKYVSLIDNNVWEPGITAWREVTDSYPTWIQPLGAHDVWPKDVVVSHGGKFWRSLIDNNVWEPGVSGWRETLLELGGSDELPAWVQPTGGHDAYQSGDRVSHNGQNWTSTVANNVWEPGVYGWVAD